MGRHKHRGPMIPPPNGRVIQLRQHTEQQAALLLETALGQHRLGQLQAALLGYKLLMQTLGPSHPIAWAAAFQTGVCCYQMRIYDEAILFMRFYLTKKWHDADAHYNLGNFYESAARPELAVESYRAAIAINPDHAAAENNLANTLRKLGDVETAELCYNRILARDPKEAPARYNLSYVLLLRGQFPRGFHLYEERWRCDTYVAEYGRPEITTPRLHPNTPACRLFVHQEQGLGDTLQALRFLPYLVAQGHDVIFEAPTELSGWFTAVEPLCAGVRVHPRRLEVPEHDAHLPMMSLPSYCQLHEEAQIPPVLRPPVPEVARERAARWLVPDGRPVIGLCWAGNANHHNDRYRSMRAEELIPLLERPFTRFVSLQVGARGAELFTAISRVTLAPDSEIIDASAHLSDFVDTAALVEACDVVVTVDTSIAHLAGTLGVRTLLLTSWLSEWRWQLERTDSPWYPSIELLRQPTLGDWPSTIAAACARLDQLHATPPRTLT